MSKKVVPLPSPRLRAVSEERLIDRPLLFRRRGVTRLIARKRPGLLVWGAALVVVAAFFALGG